MYRFDLELPCSWTDRFGLEISHSWTGRLSFETTEQGFVIYISPNVAIIHSWMDQFGSEDKHRVCSEDEIWLSSKPSPHLLRLDLESPGPLAWACWLAFYTCICNQEYHELTVNAMGMVKKNKTILCTINAVVVVDATCTSATLLFLSIRVHRNGSRKCEHIWCHVPR